MLKVFPDVVGARDRGNFVFLFVLDLSAPFESVDQGIIRQRPARSFGVRGSFFLWLELYLTDSTQSVLFDEQTTASHKTLFGVPHDSVWAPLLFTLFIADIGLIFQARNLPHYADDAQLCFFCTPQKSAALKLRVIACIDDNLMNPAKSDVMLQCRKR